MSSVVEEIEKFTQPLPCVLDDEDDVNCESNAKLSVKLESETSENLGVLMPHSILRSKTAPLLHETDSRYSGKRISRKSLENFDASSCSSNENNDSGEDDTQNNYNFGKSQESIESFKKFFAVKRTHFESIESESCNSEELIESSSNDDSEEPGTEELEESDMIQQFSQVNVANEIEKGEAVKAQQELWYKLCECRIKMQKLLLAVNKMPQWDNWGKFKEKSGDSYRKDLNRGLKMVQKLLNCFFEFQTEFFESNTHAVEGNFEGVDAQVSDEEISSSSDYCGSDVEEKHLELRETCLSDTKKPTKRKLTDKLFNEIISKRHKTLDSYRNLEISTWDHKTRLTSGRITQKSFDMFDQTAMDQIKQILQDKQRLIKRTQIKRTDYQVLGKDGTLSEEESEKNLFEDVQIKTILKEHDPEIFDDEDFYRQLLKDIIDSKSVGIDPVIFSKQLEIQRVRSKMKRKVDTKASKGRKIRFDVHSKLVNFMAPVINTSMTLDAKDELFHSLFGQHRTVPAVT